MAGGARTVEAGGDSLRAALDNLTEQHPALRSRLLGDDGEIATFVNIYVDSEDVRVSGGLDTPARARRERDRPAGHGRRQWRLSRCSPRRAPCSSAGRSEARRSSS